MKSERPKRKELSTDSSVQVKNRIYYNAGKRADRQKIKAAEREEGASAESDAEDALGM